MHETDPQTAEGVLEGQGRDGVITWIYSEDAPEDGTGTILLRKQEEYEGEVTVFNTLDKLPVNVTDINDIPLFGLDWCYAFTY